MKNRKKTPLTLDDLKCYGIAILAALLYAAAIHRFVPDFNMILLSKVVIACTILRIIYLIFTRHTLGEG